MRLSAILICATVTVFAFSVGEAIAPALIAATRNTLLFPFVMIAGAYRNRVELAKAFFGWGLFFAVIVFIWIYGGLS